MATESNWDRCEPLADLMAGSERGQQPWSSASSNPIDIMEGIRLLSDRAKRYPYGEFRPTVLDPAFFDRCVAAELFAADAPCYVRGDPWPAPPGPPRPPGVDWLTWFVKTGELP